MGPLANSSGREGIELLSECRRLRGVAASVHNSLLEKVPQEVILDNGRKLGVVSGPQESPSIDGDEAFELPAVLDFTFYTYRRAGKSLVDEYLNARAPNPGSAEDLVLRAMQRARFSLFQVGRISPPGGCLELEDLLHGDRIFLMDPQLSRFAMNHRPLNIAGRMIPLPQFWQSTGAIAFIHSEEVRRLLEDLLNLYQINVRTVPVPATKTQEPGLLARALSLCMMSRRSKVVRTGST